MNKKPPELPNIEDATLRACLAPLVEAISAGGEPVTQPSVPVSVAAVSRPPLVAAGSNDNPRPAADKIVPVDCDRACIPKTLAEWRSQGDDEYAALRMVEVFLNMTDVELATAVAEFPRQIAGTVTQIARIKLRLAAQYDKVTAAMALLDRARLTASIGTGTN